MNDIVLRHRTASGRDPWNVWEIDATGMIAVAIRLATTSDGICLALPVASSSRPKPFAFSIARLDDSRFRIMPMRWFGPPWMPRVTLYDERLPVHPLLLTHCPPEIADELATQ